MGATFRDRLGSILMLAFIAVLWWQRDYTSPFGGIFPDRIMAIMAIFVVLALALSFTRYRIKEAGNNQELTGVTGKQWFKLSAVILILMLWVLLFRYLGFALTGVLGFGLMAWLISGRWGDWKVLTKAMALGALIAFVMYMIFDYMLLVPLPRGNIFG